MRRRFVIACAIASLALGVGWQTAAFAGGNNQGGGNQGGGGNQCGGNQNGNNQGGGGWSQCCNGGNPGANNQYGGKNGGGTTSTTSPCYGPHAPMLSTSTSVSSPGGSFTVSGKGFDPSESVTLTLDCPGASPVPIGGAGTNPKGMFSTTVTIPKTTKAGQCRIVATGSGGDSAQTAITIKVVHGYPTGHHGRGHGHDHGNDHNHSHHGSKH